MRRILFIAIALMAMVVTALGKNAKTPVGCWKLVRTTDSTYTELPGNVMDTMLVQHIWDADSIILCPKGHGTIQYYSVQTRIYRTKDGYYNIYEQENLIITDFTWKYKDGKVQFLTCSKDAIGHIVERMRDNKGTQYPSRYRNILDDDAKQFIIDFLPLLKLEYDPNTGQLRSRSIKQKFKRCSGKPKQITHFQNSLTI